MRRVASPTPANKNFLIKRKNIMLKIKLLEARKALLEARGRDNSKIVKKITRRIRLLQEKCSEAQE